MLVGESLGRVEKERSHRIIDEILRARKDEEQCRHTKGKTIEKMLNEMSAHFDAEEEVRSFDFLNFDRRQRNALRQ